MVQPPQPLGAARLLLLALAVALVPALPTRGAAAQDEGPATTPAAQDPTSATSAPQGAPASSATEPAAAPAPAETRPETEAQRGADDERPGGWRLAGADSPYLRQHADNPVTWYPWGDEAFAKARERGVPVFVSIGYSACHWCHVMEQQTFEDAEVAAFLDAHFVAIKVDREQRPDVDARYMDALVAMIGSGGWPLSVFCTPDGRPFAGGTFFPPRDTPRRIGFLTVLQRVEEAWRTDRPHLLDLVERNGPLLAGLADPPRPEGAFDPAATLDSAAAELLAALDPERGGVASASPQRFPPSQLLQVLLARARRGAESGLAPVLVTLDAMAGGGLRDHIAGGFHRYSTDPRWEIPHFEKMLYDNAQLATTYAKAFALTGEPRFAQVAAETLAWMDTDLGSPEGLLFAARDADSLPFDEAGRPLPEAHPEEGRVDLWSPGQIEAVLGPDDGPLFARLYHVTEQGDVEDGLSLPRPMLARPVLLAAAADELPAGSDPDAWLTRCLARLRAARAARPQPFRDEKCLAAWNGLALTAFATGGRLLDDAALRERAGTLAHAILTHLLDEQGQLAHQRFDGTTSGAADLTDHAAVARGLLDAYQATGDGELLAGAVRLTRTLLARFEDPDQGGFFETAGDDPLLPQRARSSEDDVIPAGGSLALELLLRLAPLDDDGLFAAAAERALQRSGPAIPARPLAYPALLGAVGAAVGPLAEVVVDDRSPDQPLLAEARRTWLPAELLVPDAPAAAAALTGSLFEAEPSLLAGRRAPPGEARAWVCRRGACLRPAPDVATLREQWAPVLTR